MFSGRILITGAGGFVGRHLVPTLHESFPNSEIIASQFDVTDPNAVKIAIEKIRPDAVVHLAAIAAVGSAREILTRHGRSIYTAR